MKIKFNAETGEWEIHTKNNNVPIIVEGFASRNEALRWIDMQHKVAELFGGNETPPAC